MSRSNASRHGRWAEADCLIWCCRTCHLERVLVCVHAQNSLGARHRSVRLHPFDRARARSLPVRAEGRRRGRRPYVGGQGRRTAARVRPGHPRSRPRSSSRWPTPAPSPRGPGCPNRSRVSPWIGPSRSCWSRWMVRTPPCSTRSTSDPPTMSLPACGFASGGAWSGSGRSPTSSASSRVQTARRRRGVRRPRRATSRAGSGRAAAERRRLGEPRPPSATTAEGDVTGIVVPIELDYLYAASPEESLFYTSLSEGKLVGQRCPTCGKVYIPPRERLPGRRHADRGRGRAARHRAP